MKAKCLFGVVLSMALSGSALVPASGAAADSSSARTVEKAYYVTRVPGAPLQSLECGETSPRGCVKVVPKAGERFVNVTINDDAGMAVYGYVNQDVDGDGMSDIDGPFCGKTDFPFRVKPKVPVRIFILTHYDHCPGAVATKGTVSITLGSSRAAVRQASR